MPPTPRHPKWVAHLFKSSASDDDAPSDTRRARRAWPFLVSILVGLTLLYSAPLVTLIAAFTLIAVASGVVVVQRRLRRRHAASTKLPT